MQTIMKLEMKLEKLVSKLNKSGFMYYQDFQETVADRYDIFNDDQLVEYYESLIDEVNNLLDDGYDAKNNNDDDVYEFYNMEDE